jgi:outer membrane lipoprotein-sorting protein
MSQRIAAVAATLLGAVALSACGPDQISADEIVARMKQAQQEITDIHGLLAVDFVTNERSGTLLVENWNETTGATDAEGQPIRKQRSEVRQASDARQVGTTYVTDGNKVWLYTPAENTVLTGTRAELEQLRDTARDQTGGDPTQGMESFDQLVQDYLDAMHIEVLPDEQVAGQNAWKLKLTPKPTEGGQGPDLSRLATAYLWVDQQRALPLKLQADAKDAGQGGYEAQSLVTNQGIDDSTFTFSIPAGARVITLAELIAELTPQTVTLDEAKARADFPLLAPGEVPQGTSLVEVQIFKRRGQSVVVQNYAGPTSFSLVQSRGPIGDDREPPAGSKVSTVSIRNGQQATLITAPGGQNGTLLRWTENGVNVIIAGTLSADAALALAESLR